MFTHKGGHIVKRGTYWKVGAVQSIDLSETGVLPGNGAATYVRIPLSAMLVAGPIIGLAYVITLPFAWIAVSLFVLAQRLVNVMAGMANKSTSFGWRPIEAYLAGRRRKKERKARKNER